MVKRKRLRILAAVILVGGMGILALHRYVERIYGPPSHIVMSNSEGHAIDPTGNLFCESWSALCNGWHVPAWFIDYDVLGQDGRESYDGYLKRLFAKLREHADRKNRGTRKVLIVVHGGLNSQRDAIRRAERLTEIIKNSPESYYPIFINWDSSFFSSYYDYLFHIRQGEYYRSWYPRAWLLAPVYFASDTVRGVVQAPILWFSELGKTEPEEWLQKNVSARISLPWGSTMERDYERAATTLAKRYAAHPDGNVLAIWEGQDQQKFWPEQFWSSLTWGITIPIKIVTAPLLDAYSESSFRMNVRRTRIQFHTDAEFAKKADGGYQEPGGALAVFMRRLYREYRADKERDPRLEWDITLVGHSMGTMILNEMIRGYGVVTAKDARGRYVDEVLPFNQIVYMAAACSVRDYEDSIFPYLRNNTRAHFYHLTLHEEAEERERYDLLVPYLDPLPRGSILVWVDDFMSNPLSYLDLTLGRFSNLMVTIHDTPDQIRRQISVKAFGAGETVTAPQGHNDFMTKFKFWIKECWRPSTGDRPDCFNDAGHY